MFQLRRCIEPKCIRREERVKLTDWARVCPVESITGIETLDRLSFISRIMDFKI